MNYRKVMQAQKRKEVLGDRSSKTHGTYYGYQLGCRCDECVKVMWKRRIKYRSAMEDPNDRRHGTSTGYSYGCRCDRCREAYREYTRQSRKRKKANRVKELSELLSDPNDKRHGTLTGYNYGCHCGRCKKAYAVNRWRRKAEIDSNPDDPRHGTDAGYNAGCRCPMCVNARAFVSRARRKPTREEASKVMTCYKGDKIVAVGTPGEIAEEIGRSVETVMLYTTKRYQAMHPKDWKVL